MVKTIEQQISEREVLLGKQEQELRSAFIPGTIEKQFELGSASAIKKARLGLSERKRVGLLEIFKQRQSLEKTKAEVATVRKAQLTQQKELERQQIIKDVFERINKDKGFGSDFLKLSKADQKSIRESVRKSKTLAVGRSKRAIISSAESKVGQTLSGEARAELVSTGSIEVPGISLLSTPQQTLAKPEDFILQDLAPQSIDVAPSQSLQKPSKGESFSQSFLTTSLNILDIKRRPQFEQSFIDPTIQTLQASASGFERLGKDVKAIDTGNSKLAFVGTQVAGTGLGAIGILIPKTEVDLLLTGGGGFALSKASPLIKRVAGTGLTFFGGKGALDPSLTPEERVASGIVGVGGLSLVGTPTKFQLGIKEQKAQLKILIDKEFITKETGASLLEGIKLQKFLRGRPDVEIIKPSTAIIPRGITSAEREAFKSTLFEPGAVVFGGQALSVRGIRKSGDIDIALPKSVPDIKIAVVEQASLFEEASLKPVRTGRGKGGGSVGLGGEKAFDIKSLALLESFPFSQKPVKADIGGVQFTKVSEQFSRALSGTLELRKSGKDIGDVILSARALIEGAKGETKLDVFPGLPPGLRQVRQFQIRQAEKRLESLQGAVPELRQIVGRVGESKIVDLPSDFKGTTPALTLADIFPKGKRGELGGGVKIDFKLPRQSEFKLSDFKSSGFKPSGLRPSAISSLGISNFLPSAISGFKPSQILPGKTPVSSFAPSTFTTPFTPSGTSSFKPPKPPGFPGTPGLPRDPFEPPRPPRRPPKGKRLKGSDRKKKVRKLTAKRKKKRTPIRPSFTASVLDLKAFDPIKISPQFGISPFTIRRKLVKKTKKKAKKR